MQAIREKEIVKTFISCNETSFKKLLYDNFHGVRFQFDPEEREKSKRDKLGERDPLGS